MYGRLWLTWCTVYIGEEEFLEDPVVPTEDKEEEFPQGSVDLTRSV